MPKFLRNAIRLNDIWDEKEAHVEQNSTEASYSLDTQIQQRKQEVGQAVLFGLQDACRAKKAPVGEGFMVVSSKDDFISMEKKLNGKWGSYRMFEK